MLFVVCCWVRQCSKRSRLISLFIFLPLYFSASHVLSDSTTAIASNNSIEHWGDGWLSDTQAIMGTEVSVTLWHKDSAVAERTIAAVMAEMRRIDAHLSPYIETSALTRMNQKASKAPLKIDDELVLLLDKSLYISALSEGAFDVTFASLGRYYDYRKKLSPSEAQREELLSAIDYRHLKLDKAKRTIFYANPHVYVDLGGIAKGYAVDRAVHIIREAGVTHASVSAGGDSRILGDRRGRPWIVGIKNPRISEASPQDSVIRIPLTDVAVSTSGDYERFFIDEKSGQRIHHILNPKTGKSASGVVSVTILGDHGVDTDPLSTTVFVLGVKKGLALINRLPGFDCIIIDQHGQAHYSDGLMPPEN